MYVLRVKEYEEAKDIAEKELKTVRERFEKELDMVTKRLGKELKDAREMLENEKDHVSRLQVLEQEQNAELIKLRSQVKEFGDIRTVLEEVQGELVKEKQSNKASMEALSDQTQELQSMKRKLKELAKEHRQVLSRCVFPDEKCLKPD
jgi:hypothetical protein